MAGTKTVEPGDGTNLSRRPGVEGGREGRVGKREERIPRCRRGVGFGDWALAIGNSDVECRSILWYLANVTKYLVKVHTTSVRQFRCDPC